MTTAETMQHLMETRTKYRISQDLGCAPTLVNYWLTGTKMGAQYRLVVELVYGITINDNSMGPSSINS